MKIANAIIANVGCKSSWSTLCGWLKRRRPDIATLQKSGSSEPFPEEELRKTDYESWFPWNWTTSECGSGHGGSERLQGGQHRRDVMVLVSFASLQQQGPVEHRIAVVVVLTTLIDGFLTSGKHP